VFSAWDVERSYFEENMGYPIKFSGVFYGRL
jgi:hypothetical protein